MALQNRGDAPANINHNDTAIQGLMCHTSIMTTQRYIHTRLTALEAAIAATSLDNVQRTADVATTAPEPCHIRGQGSCGKWSYYRTLRLKRQRGSDLGSSDSRRGGSSPSARTISAGSHHGPAGGPDLAAVDPIPFFPAIRARAPTRSGAPFAEPRHRDEF